MTSSGQTASQPVPTGVTSHVNMSLAGKQEKPTADLSSQKVDELHAIIEDPMSDENRNKRISIEESNKRVRKWLNSESSYFGPLDEDHTESKAARDSSEKRPVKILNAKTEVIDQGNVVFSAKAIPPLVSVGYSLPGSPSVSASVSSRDMRNPNVLQHSLPQGSRYQESSVPTHNNTSGKQFRDIYGQITPQIAGNKTAFHIEKLFSASSAGHPLTTKPTTATPDSQTALKDYLGFVGNAQKVLDNTNRQTEPSNSFDKEVSADVGMQMPRSLSGHLQALSKPGSLIQSAPASNIRLSAQGTPIEEHQTFSAIPPLRVTPTASQLSPRMSFAPVQHRMASVNRSITPTRESPASRGSSMSPQASSMKTDISSTKQTRQDSTKGSIASPRASPQNAPKDNNTHADYPIVRPGIAFQAPTQNTNKPILPKLPFTTDYLHSAPPMQRLHLQQQQHFAEIMRNRFMENQRLAAVDMFRPPHIGAVSSQFKQGEYTGH